MTPQQVRGIIGNGGHFFSVAFVKRSDKTVRTMVARLDVKKHLRGGSLPFDPNKHNLVCCWIPEWERRENDRSNGYRLIPCEGIIKLVAASTEYHNRIPFSYADRDAVITAACEYWDTRAA